jgi:hypothetical protein
VRADDVGGHQVGRELDAAVGQPEALGERAHQQRLAEAGNPFEQDVPVGDEAGEHPVDHGLLADQHLSHLGAQTIHALGEERQFLVHRAYSWFRAPRSLISSKYCLTASR